MSWLLASLIMAVLWGSISITHTAVQIVNKKPEPNLLAFIFLVSCITFLVFGLTAT